MFRASNLVVVKGNNNIVLVTIKLLAMDFPPINRLAGWAGRGWIGYPAISMNMMLAFVHDTFGIVSQVRASRLLRICSVVAKPDSIIVRT
jgi:hypothetical protein